MYQIWQLRERFASSSCFPERLSTLRFAGASSVLHLKKLILMNRTTTSDELEARDRARHARILRNSTTAGAVEFYLTCSFDPKLVGMYYTKIKLGSPPGEYHMLIDTGSDISWISCSSCSNCPRTSGLGITVVVSPSAKPIKSAMYPCYLISSSFSENIAEVFPTISLNFVGDASMNLTPTDYLEDMDFVNGAAKWCIHFIRRDISLTTLGDVELKDRIIVYDLARQRIGWANYDCSFNVNVSITSGTYDVTQASTIYHMLGLTLFILNLFWIQSLISCLCSFTLDFSCIVDSII